MRTFSKLIRPLLCCILMVQMLSMAPIVGRAQDSQITEADLRKTLEGLTAYHRWAGTASAQKAAEYIVGQMKAAGYAPTEQAFDFTEAGATQGIQTSSRATNIVAVKKANVEDPDILVVSAHYDGMPSTVGAVDDGSGTAALLALAKAVVDLPSDTEIRFVAFSGEEEGLKGSEYYVSQLTQAEKDRMIGDIQLEMLGQYDTQSINLYTVDGQPTLVGNLLQDSAKEVTGAVFPIGIETRSDHVPFALAGIPAVMLVQNNEGVEYHTVADNINIVDFGKVLSASRVVERALEQVMSPQTTLLAQKAYQITDTKNASCTISDETIFFYGEIKMLTDQRIGGGGTLAKSWHDDELDWDLENYDYRAKWFGMDTPLPTTFRYRRIDADRFLDSVYIRIGEAGWSGPQAMERLTQCFGKPVQAEDAYIWEQAVSSRQYILSADPTEQYEIQVMNDHEGAGHVIQTYDIANGIAQYKDAPPQHYKLLEFTEKLVGPNNALVNSLDVWTDGISFILGRSFAASDKRDRFTLQIDINDIFDASGAYRHLDRSLFTFVHEYAHALTLNDTQIDIGKHDKNLFYFNHESFRPDSYLRAFYDAFWQPVGRDDASAYFLEHPESFVDQYASSDCNEDIAESFALFVLAAKQTGDSIAEQKINFFYRYPELVAERTRIREAFGIAGD